MHYVGCEEKSVCPVFSNLVYIPLKGTAKLIITTFYFEDLNEPCILISVSSKLVEKYGNIGRWNICNLAVMEAAIL